VALDSPDKGFRPAPAAGAADADDFLHRLVEFYRIYNPNRLKQGLDEIYTSYHHREEILNKQLRAKYGADLDQIQSIGGSQINGGGRKVAEQDWQKLIRQQKHLVGRFEEQQEEAKRIAECIHCGWLNMRERNHKRGGKGSVSKYVWTRRYFAVTQQGELRSYMDSVSFLIVVFSVRTSYCAFVSQGYDK
jgi:hypothetical protein